ncbi:hypothetical protein, partial [Streptomyces sp. MBT65]|uniref:hypothetical protein n=1 Tax=Streptomyces sp. MBT65 TaxID=1488395 RepID=UPI001F394101
ASVGVVSGVGSVGGVADVLTFGASATVAGGVGVEAGAVGTGAVVSERSAGGVGVEDGVSDRVVA